MTAQKELTVGEYFLGRDSECDLHIDNHAVSGKHLLFRVSDGNHLMIKDLGSSNGTWRFGKERIELEQPEDGDWYQMGTVQALVKKMPV